MSNGDSTKEQVLNVSNKVETLLKPCCNKIMVVGSIRRLKDNPHDVDIVLIPKNKDEIISILNNIGIRQNGGSKKEAWIVDDVKVELYYATEDNFGAFVLMYTGSKEYNITMRIKAKKQGYMLNQYGLFENDTNIVSKTEEEIFKALNMPYVIPRLR